MRIYFIIGKNYIISSHFYVVSEVNKKAISARPWTVLENPFDMRVVPTIQMRCVISRYYTISNNTKFFYMLHNECCSYR